MATLRRCRRRTRPAGRSRSVPRPAARTTLAVGADALVGLDHALRRAVRAARCGGRTGAGGLVGDAQRIAKAARDDQQRRSPLRSSSALVATVVPIFTHADLRRRDRLAGMQAQQDGGCRPTAASRYCSGFGQQLVVASVPSGGAPDHVGEGAAAVDPELPAGAVRHEAFHSGAARRNRSMSRTWCQAAGPVRKRRRCRRLRISGSPMPATRRLRAHRRWSARRRLAPAGGGRTLPDARVDGRRARAGAGSFLSA